MNDSVVTQSDLEAFRVRLLNEIKQELSGLAASTESRWLKSAQVRKLLRISPGTLQTLRNNGTIPFSLVGGIYYYAARDIEALMPGGNADASCDG